jgi:hypothetical protein
VTTDQLPPDFDQPLAPASKSSLKMVAAWAVLVATRNMAVATAAVSAAATHAGRLEADICPSILRGPGTKQYCDETIRKGLSISQG